MPRRATALTRAGMAREAAAYETNLYRLCGDWMPGTESPLPDGDLEALAGREGVPTLVPSHGPVRSSTAVLSGIGQTRAYLQWLDAQFTLWASQGWEMTEVLRAPVPAPYRGWAAFETEYVRNVVHPYPGYERAVLEAPRPR